MVEDINDLARRYWRLIKEWEASKNQSDWDDAMIDISCYFHPNEIALTTDYIQCFECGHSYHTAEELIAADHAIRVALEQQFGDGKGDAIEPRDPAEIFICPVCAHDY